MRSPGNINDNANKTIERTTLLLVAISLNCIEFFIPRIPLFPWLKPGLANCITILWIIKFGLIEAILFTLLRVWTVGFYFGFSFLTLSLSLSGGILASFVMGISWSFFGKKKILGIIGIGIIGAMFHNIGQLLMVYLLMARNFILFYQIPFMGTASIVFGGLVGLLAHYMAGINENVSNKQIQLDLKISTQEYTADLLSKITSTLIILFCISLLIIDRIIILSILALSVTIFVQLVYRGSIKVLLSPFTRFWLLFLFIGILHLFFSHGEKIGSAPFLTYEGVNQTIIQWLRIWTWLQISSVLMYFKFHIVLFSVLGKIFSKNGPTLKAGILAVELFPQIPDLVGKNISSLLISLFTHPIHAIRNFSSEIYKKVAVLITTHLREVEEK